MTKDEELDEIGQAYAKEMEAKSLDDKLREIPILKNYMLLPNGETVPTNYNLNDEDIEAIKQAFADEGYINWRTLPKGIYNHSGRTFSQISAEEAMTAQEWVKQTLDSAKDDSGKIDPQMVVEILKEAA